MRNVIEETVRKVIEMQQKEVLNGISRLIESGQLVVELGELQMSRSPISDVLEVRQTVNVISKDQEIIELQRKKIESLYGLIERMKQEGYNEIN